MNILARTSIIILCSLLSKGCLFAEKVTLLDAQPETFNNEAFQMSLEPGWRADHNNDSYGWQNDGTSEEVRFTVFRVSEALDRDQLQKGAEELISIRRGAADQLSDGKAVLTETDRKAWMDGVELSFQGEDPTNHVTFSTIVRANSKCMVSFTYIKYDPPLSKQQFEKRCNELSANWVVH